MRRGDPLNLIRIMPAKGRAEHLSFAGLLNEAAMISTIADLKLVSRLDRASAGDAGPALPGRG